MQPDASPAENDQSADGEDAAEGRSSRRAARFQYGTGDKPLDGYTIKRGVGRGGFGEVYFATSDAGKEVALKLIRRNLDVELRGVRQCLNLKHPNLVAIYDLRADEADDQWVVMEYVAGESLEEAVARHPEGMPIEEAIGWFRGIAAGVAYLHSSGVVHRDLKPGNIYLERGAGPLEQRVKIGDYGLSKFISASRRSGQTESVGTVHYMAPEIAGGRYGREIDTYALGVILYELLTGRVPFEGESVGEVLMKHLTAEPELDRLTEPYRSMVAGALAKDPEVRLGDVDQLIALLPSAEPSVEPAYAEPITPTVGEVWAPVSRPPHTDHPTPPREPLWQGLVELTNDLRTGWRAWSLPPLGKGLILFGGVCLAMTTAWAWLGVLVPLLMLYAVYYVVWAAFLQDHSAAPAALHPREHASTIVHHTKPSTPKRSRYNWRAAARLARRERPLRERAKSVTGSMLGSAVVATIASSIAAPWIASGTPVDPFSLGVWLACVTTIGSWGVLVSNALSDTHRETRLPRRELQTAFGMFAGAAAFHLMQTLGLALPHRSGVAFDHRSVLLEGLFGFDLYEGVDVSGPLVSVPFFASLVFFGVLFLLVRWWNSADYVRRNRVGVWSVAGAVLCSWLVTLVTWYPQPLGMVLAGVIALAVQAASPWCPPSRREAMARGEV